MKIAVLGTGAWGSALASHLAAQHDTVLWGRDADLLKCLAATHQNPAYLPDIALNPQLRCEAQLPQALEFICMPDSLCVLAVPVAGLRGLCQALRTARQIPKQLLWVCKGFEADTQLLPHQVIAEELGNSINCGVLSGPSFAREVATGLPVALTVASTSSICRELTVQAFHHAAMRVYTSDDVTGVEVGGAVKNVLAIATGISDGLALGLNARAALITRGLAEITRLGLALGGRAETFTGLTGLGDLVLTAIGDLSRNRKVGLQLAQGISLSQILTQLGHVAEGVRCARTVLQIAQHFKIEMPITEAVCAVLFDGQAPLEAVSALLCRSTRAEA